VDINTTTDFVDDF